MASSEVVRSALKEVEESLLESIVERRADVVIDKTFADLDRLRSCLSKLVNAGYRVFIVGVVCQPQNACLRVCTRAFHNKRFVPLNVVLADHRKFVANISDIHNHCGHLYHAFFVFENDGHHPRLIYRSQDGRYGGSCELMRVWERVFCNAASVAELFAEPDAGSAYTCS